MRILVYDVAARVGGALSILKAFVEDIVLDRENEYLIITSIDENKIMNLQKVTDNVKFYYRRDLGSNYLKRAHFEMKGVQKVINDFDPDCILSLQNTPMNIRTNIPQFVYMHQPGYFHYREKKYRKFYKGIKRVKMMLRELQFRLTMNKTQKYFVQTEWIRNLLVDKYKINQNSVEVVKPSTAQLESRIKEIKDNSCLAYEEFYKSFERIGIYVTSATEYKNIEILIETLNMNKTEKDYSLGLVLTIDGTENTYARKIKSMISKYNLNSNILLCGYQEHEVILSMISRSDIIFFPSVIETFGLPLIEAHFANKEIPIFAADLPYAREVAPNSYFFDPHSANELYLLIKRYFDSDLVSTSIVGKAYEYHGDSYMKIIDSMKLEV